MANVNTPIDESLMAQVKAKVVKEGYKKGDIKEYIETAIKERLMKDA
jgi:hypothetical protein